jgi:hypothetical protein
VPRTIIALYDGADVAWADTGLHRMAEMPLNHLGLIVEPHDIRKPLPDLAGRDDVRGIVTWWSDDVYDDPAGFLQWASEAADRGTRFLFLGSLGFQRSRAGEATPAYLVDRLLRRLGVRMLRNANDPAFLSAPIVKDQGMVEFERALPPAGRVTGALRALNTDAKVFLSAEGKQGTSDLVIVTPFAGFVSDGYTHYSVEGSTFRQWYINPFRLFSLTFGTGRLPVPDTTTIGGRRIFFSHIDGDGWRNETKIANYRTRNARAIDVILNEVLNGFPDLPVTVAAIAADLDPEWCGDERAISAAYAVYALPHVEAASHTYSHPFYWGMFENGAATGERIGDARCAGASGAVAHPVARAYSARAFNLDLEVSGAAGYIARFLPPGKPLRLLQWSGDTSPFPGAVAASRAAGLLNINGGDSRFDANFPSVSWVSSLGRYTEGGWQIYAAASNENTYTYLWTGRFYGFQQLSENLRRMESPRRLKPINVYYHVYSGERLSSLNALIENLRAARAQEIAPIRTTDYVEIANGFYTCRIVELGDGQWRIEDRGALNTMRVDDRIGEVPDLARSQGVLGWRRHQGSLYVALDPAHPAPVLALGPEPAEQPASLVESRWPVRDMARADSGFSFIAAGFGPGEMTWRVPNGARHQVTWAGGGAGTLTQIVARRPDGTINFSLPATNSAGIFSVRVRRLLDSAENADPVTREE